MADRASADVAGVAAGAETPDVVIGNHCCKYQTSNPAIRWLTERFLGRLERVLDAVEREVGGARVLEAGCGEGEIARRLHARWGDVTALDLPDAGLRGLWEGVEGPRFLHGDAQRLPFADKSFDVVVSVEVLEHLPDPLAGLREYARVGRELVLSVPREPIFRLGNFLTGRHVSAFGNTPGHLNHWSTAGFIRFASQVGAVRQVETPLPWTILWVREL